jgi:hypothetical protein
MFRFFGCYILFILLSAPVCLVAQNRADTLSATSADTLKEHNSDSPSSDESADDNIDQPIADSSSLLPGVIREVPAKKVSRYKNDPEYAYANDPEYWRKEKPADGGFLFRILFSRELRWILLTVFGGLILFGIYRMAKENQFGLLIGKRNQNNSEGEKTTHEEVMDYDDAIRKSQAEGNYRMAIRYMYLRMIRTMKERSGIAFKDSSTNAEIIRIMGNHPQSAAFRWLATAYEYIFYGGFAPNEELYGRLKNKFDAFQENFSN